MNPRIQTKLKDEKWPEDNHSPLRLRKNSSLSPSVSPARLAVIQEQECKEQLDSPQTNPKSMQASRAIKSQSRVSSNPCSYVTGMFKSTLAACLKKNSFPDMPSLEGDVFFGRFWDLFNKEGRGLGDVIMKGAKKAETDPNGRCQWYFGPRTRVVMITHPSDIEKIIGKHYQDLVDYDQTGTLEQAFGKDSVFVRSIYTKEFEVARTRFLDALHSAQALKRHMPKMQQVVHEYVEKIKEKKTINPLYEFMNFLALDVIAKTQLGFENLPEKSKKKISEVINKIVLVLASPWNQLIASYVPFSTYYPFNRCLMKELTQLLDEGHNIIKEDLIRPNQENIFATENWLNTPDTKADAEQLYTKAILEIVSQILVAGHETTTKLLFFSLMVLGDPKQKVAFDKIREEIDNEIKARGKPLSEWDASDFANLPMLRAFLLEVLRLHPPIPDMVFGVKNPISFAGGQLNSGDLIVISPRVTHKLVKTFGDDAMEFKWDRFLGKEGVISPFNYEFIAFGFKRRQCPGKLFALQEAMVAVATIVSQFDLKANHSVDHMKDYYQAITMRLEKEVEEKAGITFAPRVIDEKADLTVPLTTPESEKSRVHRMK